MKLKRKSEVRKMLEREVAAFNSPLRRAVKSMDTVILLRNCHPLYRADYARKLYNLGEITEAQEFEFKRGVDVLF